MEKDAARREDDDENDEGRSKELGRRICRPGQKTGGVRRRCVRRRATALTAAAVRGAPQTMAPTKSTE